MVLFGACSCNLLIGTKLNVTVGIGGILDSSSSHSDTSVSDENVIS